MTCQYFPVQGLHGVCSGRFPCNFRAMSAFYFERSLRTGGLLAGHKKTPVVKRGLRAEKARG